MKQIIALTFATAALLLSSCAHMKSSCKSKDGSCCESSKTGKSEDCKTCDTTAKTSPVIAKKKVKMQ